MGSAPWTVRVENLKGVRLDLGLVDFVIACRVLRSHAGAGKSFRRAARADVHLFRATYDPDLATSHEPPVQADPLKVLAGVISTSGADLSATETRRQEEAAFSADWRVQAEGAAVTRRRQVPIPLERSNTRDSYTPSL